MHREPELPATRKMLSPHIPRFPEFRKRGSLSVKLNAASKNTRGDFLR
jgi:hypothetical protein